MISQGFTDPTPDQNRFHGLRCKYPAFVGGFGTGKSETMARQAVRDACKGGSSSLIGLYEPTYDLVRLIMAPRIQQKLDELGLFYRYNKSENIIYTSSGSCGDFVLRTMDNPERIVGYETFRAHCDEIDTLKPDHAREFWTKVLARNRQKVEGYANKISAYTTPEGFRFVHDRWVKNGGGEYQLVQASTMGNPHLPEDYVESLRASYPAELINAYLNGEFVNLTSGTIYKSYNRVSHRSAETIKIGEPLFIGMDFNVTQQAATVYVKRQGGKEWHAVDELTGMYDTPEAIKLIKERYHGHPVTIYPDASGGGRKTVNASISDISLLRGAGFNIKAHSKNPFVKDRIMATNSAFERGVLYVNDYRCPTTANCLEQQVYGANGEPDKKSGNDHQNDATTYPIAYEFPINKPVSTIVQMRGF